MTETKTKKEIVLEGVAASDGIAHGPALVYLQDELDVPIFGIEDNEIEAEISRFDEGLLETRRAISVVRDKVAASLGEGEARIFDAHLMVLEDSALIDEVIGAIRTTKKNVEHCFNSVSQRYIAFFQSMEDEYLKERVSDIQDVSRRLLQTLIGRSRPNLAHLPSEGIIVSEDLTPSDTATVDRSKLRGFITDMGGKTSHTVIMARSLRIPAVVGLHDATEQIKNGDYLLIDGYEGMVVINPSEARLSQFSDLADKHRQVDAIYNESLGLASETKDGRPVALMANIEGPEDMERSLEMRADGVGLYRTEALFLRDHGYPDEAAQYEEYSKVVKMAAGHEVTIRTLDVGGDKTVGDDSVKEDNSFMGFRAIRFCLGNPVIFRTQLRAILRASAHGKVKIMYPMISGLGELRGANEILESVKDELRVDGLPFDEVIEVGAMIEVPSAATIIDLIASECDFLSIGSNDLIQYLLAVDRLNDLVADLYQPTHPAVIRSLRAIIEGGVAAGKPVGVCGEIAGDAIFASLLIGMGASSLSFTPSLMPEVKYFVQRVDSAAATRLVDEVVQMKTETEILEHLEAYKRSILGDLIVASNL
ncbi:MAG: phosphoenolpyruvate--protein phosphotransferase [Verrucomicrobiota bacterium]